MTTFGLYKINECYTNLLQWHTDSTQSMRTHEIRCSLDVWDCFRAASLCSEMSPVSSEMQRMENQDTTLKWERNKGGGGLVGGRVKEKWEATTERIKHQKSTQYAREPWKWGGSTAVVFFQRMICANVSAVTARNLFVGLASVLNWHMFVYTGLSRMMIFGLFNSKWQPKQLLRRTKKNQHNSKLDDVWKQLKWQNVLYSCVYSCGRNK